MSTSKGHCLICLKFSDKPLPSGDTGTLNTLSESAKCRKICHKFCTLVSRYLHLNPKYFQPEKTIKSALLAFNTIQVCSNCLPELDTFCQEYETWQIHQMKMDSTLDRILAKMRTADKEDQQSYLVELKRKLGESTKVMKGLNEFRKNFLSRVKKLKRKSFPRVVAVRNDGLDDDLFIPVIRKRSKSKAKITTASQAESRVKEVNNGESKTSPKDDVIQQSHQTHSSVHSLRARFTAIRKNKISTFLNTNKIKTEKLNSMHLIANRNSGETIIEKHANRSMDPACVDKMLSISHKEEDHMVHSKCLNYPNMDIDIKQCPGLTSERHTHKDNSLLVENRMGIQAVKKSDKVSSDSFPFQCSTCEKRFRLKFYLRLHERVHTGERPYSCKICSKCFAQKSTLNKHLASHTKKESGVGFSPYGTQKSNEANHERNHSQGTQALLQPHPKRRFQCKFCPKTLACKQNLTNHEKIHLGIKSFKCDKCFKRFSRKQSLLLHKCKVVSALTQFECKICHIYFSTYQGLFAHEVICRSDSEPIVIESPPQQSKLESDHTSHSVVMTSTDYVKTDHNSFTTSTDENIYSTEEIFVGPVTLNGATWDWSDKKPEFYAGFIDEDVD